MMLLDFALLLATCATTFPPCLMSKASLASFSYFLFPSWRTERLGFLLPSGFFVFHVQSARVCVDWARGESGEKLNI